MHYEVATVLQNVWKNREDLELNTWQLRTLSAIRRCRTSSLGGHIDACDACGNISISYNSCRNRHCPKCQGHKREAWIQNRIADLLPVPYFHVVFTLPSELNHLALHRPKEVYDALFASAWQTLGCFAQTKALQAGMIALLHTWGQNLSLHPHLHCIVPGGGVDNNGKWQNIRSDGKFLFPVKAMSNVFRAKYVQNVTKKIELDKGVRKALFAKPWVVYAKRPFGNATSVVEYLGRYSHKIAISNQRLKAIDEQTVSFEYKDYKQGGKKKLMTLTHKEFIRRFAQHILPRAFVKIRHYGFLSSTWKRGKLKVLQGKLRKVGIEKKGHTKHRKCPCCKEGNLIMIEYLAKRGPPSQAPSSDSQKLDFRKS